MSGNISNDFYNIVVNGQSKYTFNFKFIAKSITNVKERIYTFSFSTGEENWITERELLERGKDFFQNIDLIALSNSKYKKLIKHRFFTQPSTVLIVKDKTNIKKSRLSFIDYNVERKSFLDKLSLSINIKPELGEKFIHKILSTSLYKSKIVSDSSIYKCRVSSKKEFISFDYMPRKENVSYIKCTFNPSKTNMDFIRSTFLILKSTCGRDYEEIIRTSGVLRIDFALDIHGVKAKNCHLNLNRSRYTTIYLDSKGTIESKIYGKGGKRFQVYDKLCEQGVNSQKPVTRYEIQLKKFPKKVELEAVFGVFKTIPDLRRYSCNKLKLELCKLDYYLIKQLGVTALRSSLQTDSEKRKLRRILRLAEKDGFGEKLIGSTRNELRRIQKLLFNPKC